MAEIFSFPAHYFNGAKAGDLSTLTTQPYDKIDGKLQDEYYRRNPHNIVRVIRRRTADDRGADSYAMAALEFRQWIEQEILIRDKEPALYAYHQEFTLDGQKRIRRGMTALLRAEEFGKKSRIYPHEATHSGPKADRLRLLTATGAHFGQIFMLYADRERAVNKVLDVHCQGAPLLEATDDFGERHRVWKVADPAAIKAIQKVMRSSDLVVADGHHRYETALNFRREMEKQGKKLEGDASFDKVMTTFVNMEDEGLAIYPTHRLLFNLPPGAMEGTLRRLSAAFDITEYPFVSEEEEPVARREMAEDLRIEGTQRVVFGLTIRGHKAHYLLAYRPTTDRKETLDVTILHGEILEKILGITLDMIAAERFVGFARHTDEAVDLTLKGSRYQAAFLVNPVKIGQLYAIVKKGNRLPQKTTDFYPKLLTGLLIAKIC